MKMLKLAGLVLGLGSLFACAGGSVTWDPLYSVFGAAHSSSPWQVGGGVSGGALQEIGTSGLKGGPTASYSYLPWDGGGGKDHLLELGGVVRRPFPGANRAPWVGAQLGLAHMRSSWDGDEYDSGESYSDTGWSGWVNAGLSVSERVSVVGGGGLTGLWEGHGKNLRFGVEIRP